MRIMGRLLAHNRAPSEIVSLYKAEDAKRGRNDPCTCGGGRKWKQCHGAPRPRTERMSALRDSSQITPTG